MIEYDSRKILIYLAVKYDGDPFKIINAIRLREDENVPYEEMQKVCDGVKSKVITYLDKDFPNRLKTMFRPPLVLFYYGDITLLDDEKRKYAVVGSREYSDYGEQVTKKLVQEMGRGKILVSGLARGIDTIGHQAALDNKVRTIAVLGSGIDNCYPEENKELYERLKKEELVISEYPNMSEPDKTHFPMRNRLVVALADAVIVPQINFHVSGTTISVNLAVGSNKPVYVVPHPIFDETVNNDLIQEGANVAESGYCLLYVILRGNCKYLVIQTKLKKLKKLEDYASYKRRN